MSESAFPPPVTVSEQAQKRLAVTPEARSYPAPADTDAWLSMVEAANRSTVQRFADTEPVRNIETIEIGDAVVYAATPPDAVEGTLYLWMHPGGFLVGGGEACRATTWATATGLGVITWGVDYGLPPLRPFPAGLDDVLATYRAALDDRDASHVAVGGTSSGGNLAAALLLRAKDEGLPMPAALLLNTPAVDLTESGDTFRTLAAADSGRSSAPEVRALYAAGADPADPFLSPVFGDLTGFPPTFLQSGTRDTMLSNTVLMHRRLLAAGVDAELHVFEAMPHGGFGGQSPEDLDHVASQRRFLVKHGV